MKILVYSDYRSVNHSVRPEAEIFLQLSSRGHDICIYSPAFDDNEPFTAAGIRICKTGQQGKISPSSIKKLGRDIRSNHYDIVFATSSRSIPTAAFACMGTKSRLIAYRGTTRGLKRHDPTSYLTVLHPRIDGVIAASEAVKLAVQKKLYKNHNRVVSIFKGHNIDWYNNPAADLKPLGIDENAVVAIAVARFRPSKGLDVLLKASHQLGDVANLHLLIVGSGADCEPYTSLIDSSPMRDRIHLTGRRDDALNLIAASSILVQASVDGEGLPRSIVEALAFGKPVISTSAGGAREVLREGKSGFVVPVRDAEAIAERLRSISTAPEILTSMAEACRDEVRGPLSHIRTADAYEQYFKSMLECEAS